MTTQLREIRISHALGLDLYRALEGCDGDHEAVMQMGAELESKLGTQRVWMVSINENGTSAAELIPSLCRLLSNAGVDARWLVLDSEEPGLYEIDKLLAERLQGLDSTGTDLESIREDYDSFLEEVAEALQSHVDPRDIVMIYGAALSGVAAFLPEGFGPRMVWCCPAAASAQNAESAAGWEFLQPYVEGYTRCLFAERRFVPPFLRDRARTINPGLDPLSHKNRDLRPYKLVGILRSAGLLDRPHTPEWAAFDSEVRVLRANQWKAEPIMNLLYKPIVLQVSRFEPLKGFSELLDGFQHLLKVYPERLPHLKVDEARVTAELEEVELVLAGPDPDDIPGDTMGQALLEALAEQHSKLPPEVAKRVHILRLPIKNRKENALTVNALQRLATVVMQCSLKHGLGLTVTEALWKGAPVVATNTGGIGHQVRSEIDGTLIDDPTDPESVAMGILEVIGDRRAAEARSRSGHKRVAENFLILQHLRTLMQEFSELLSGAGALGPRAVERMREVNPHRAHRRTAADRSA